MNSSGGNAETRTVRFTRLLNAPRDRAFDAWVDPGQVAQWWGPHGFTNPVCELDARPGGAIRIDMRGPDGTAYPMTGEYREVARPERLVFATAALDAEGSPVLEVLITVTFGEHEGKTLLMVEAEVVSATAEAAPHLAGMEAGFSQEQERLEEFLETGTVQNRMP